VSARGARIARRDTRGYWEYLREEQRGEAGCPARQAVLDQRGQATRAQRSLTERADRDHLPRAQTFSTVGGHESGLMTLQADKKHEPLVPCPRCGQPLQAGKVKTAIWREERLVVVEDIPAQVCNTCMEQYYDDATTEALRRLTSEDFASAQPTREVVVPIYSLEERILRPRPPSDDDEFEFDF